MLEELIIRDSRGICPECSGMVFAMVPQVLYRCVDCGCTLRAVSDGYSENGVVVEDENRKVVLENV